MPTHVTVRVLGRDGRPKKGARVGVHVSEFMAGGFARHDNPYTNDRGEVDFNIHSSGPLTIYVDGAEVGKTDRMESFVQVIA